MYSQCPLVSIIIPTYNCESYLEEAIVSVLSQDYSPIELIVLDDGSTDNTAELLKKYQGKFYYESHPNMGQAATLNKGWELSKGEIISYLSADDLLSKDAVSTTVKTFLENPDVILTYPDNLIINSQSKALYKYRAPEYDYYDFVSHAKCRIGVGSFFLKTAFDKLGGWNSNYRLAADYEYQLRLARLGKFKYIPQVLGYYRTHNMALSSSTVAPAVADEFITIMKNELENISDKKLLAAKSKILSRSYIFSARAHLESGRYKKALSYLATALKLYPCQFIKRDFYKALLNIFFKKSIYKKIKKAIR